jgi:formylglycine-generating enzyme required for sulfatase activity
MHGNVWEWCADDWHDNYKSAPSNGSIWLGSDKASSTKVLRGGSWYNSPGDCRSAGRLNLNPACDINNSVGFRVVCVSPRTS